jgi:hypothetical protein
MCATLSLMAFIGAYRHHNGLRHSSGYVATHHPEKFDNAHANDGVMGLCAGSGFMLLAISFGFFHNKKML